MAKKSPKTPITGDGGAVREYRHGAKRKNNPPAGLAAQGKVAEAPRIRYEYNPHLPPVLRFDDTGKADGLPELLATARQRALTPEEAATLAEALRRHEPWLEWSGKREKKGFELEPVALHIHERVAAQAILKVATREDVARDLFADPQLDYAKAVQFYRHDVDWSNRLILGDSLQVMASLARREDLAGKVQMIYMDPPYGIKFASNFQPEVGRRDVKDKEADLTREPEMVRAYRDTWHLGIHSYMSYLRDRLRLSRELLAETGSLFVQIGDQNEHLLRALLDEVFGAENHVATVTFKTSVGLGAEHLDRVCDHIVWYGREKGRMKYNPLFKVLARGEKGATRYNYALFPDGGTRLLEPEERESETSLPEGLRCFTDQGLTSRRTGTDAERYPIQFQGRLFPPAVGTWRTNREGMARVLGADRVIHTGSQARFRKFFDDFGAVALNNFWEDVGGGIQSRADPKVYVVQTNTAIVERCLLMTTDPGDLVLDPTCGSGTTAFVAEQWGRRWITVDTSRVAIAIARQRLLCATFPYYKLRDVPDDEADTNPAHNFRYKTVPHVTLKSIAQNTALDPIFARHQPVLDARLAELNAALAAVPADLRARLARKLAEKERAEGKRAVTDADRRRWLLPPDNRKGQRPYDTVPNDAKSWYAWEVPFDTDADWPAALQTALRAYRAAWRAKMDEVNACITASAEQEELVDQPEIDKKVVRVSGPFTVEGVMPVEEALDDEDASPIGGAPESLEMFEAAPAAPEREPQNAEAYVDKMLRLLRADGVGFPNNKRVAFERLEALSSGEFLHGEGDWQTNGVGPRRVAVSLGPQYGPVTAYQVENAIRLAARRGCDDLVFAGFSFDGAAQAIIQDDPNPNVRIHLAHIRPDIAPGMDGLLKDTPNSQLFTVFGAPRTTLRGPDPEGLYTLRMEGVDIYNPVENTILPTSADKVAAWFLDSDYDGQTFCITQAFFPDKKAWEKLARALKTAGVMDEDRFEALSGTVSLPFPAGKYKRIAVKVIDPRGNEVMRVHRLGKQGYDVEGEE
ncbi:MAG: site-specific DNA-methyltransferase [Candidatus Sumerlaeia bacterium]|nr:site-specific DNA-methyltransferase [Candidatus Sumerlaeia bacterium]